jgi:serine/threonine protein kinase
MIGKTLSHYRIANLIGKGGMGEVYQAKDQKLGRDVAIKVLPEEFAKDATQTSPPYTVLRNLAEQTSLSWSWLKARHWQIKSSKVPFRLKRH